MRTAALITGVLGLSIGVAGLAAPTSPRVSAAPSPRPQVTATCPAGPTGSLSLYGLTATIGKPTRDTGGQNSSLKPGYVFQVMQVTLRNSGKYAYRYNPLDFVLLDDGARDYGESGADDDNLAQKIDRGTLTPGQNIHGQIAFIVPVKTTLAAIRWTPVGLGLDNYKARLDTSNRIIRLPGYTGSSASCPAGPTGSFTLDGLTVTFGALKPDGTKSDLLKPGEAFRALTVTLTNHGDYSYAYNPNDFAVVDTGARLYGQDTAYDDSLAQPLDTGKLGPGQRITAGLAYALPTGLKAVAIRWQPTGLGLYDKTHPDVGDYTIRLR